MKPPRFPHGHPDRLLDLEEALEGMFHDMLAEWIAGGYQEGELLDAIKSLAENRRLSTEANAETDVQIARAKRPGA